MTTISIHQPNYLPWFGFFAKVAASDVFVFLDDVAFSKGSYTNRVKFLQETKSRWVTIPIIHKQGLHINEILPSNTDWNFDHLNSVANWYRDSSAFSEIREEFESMLFDAAALGNLAEINKLLIIKLSNRLGFNCQFVSSSEFNVSTLGTERLIDIVKKIDLKGRYLSGQGGANYQDPYKFSEAGIELQYLDFEHPIYSQGVEDFTAGLSIMDAVFHVGWAQTKGFFKSVESKDK